MDKKETINKVLSEYARYGISEEMVEIVYDLAIEMRVPKEIIYDGMRYIFSNHLSLTNDLAIEGVGKGIIKNVISERMANNGTDDEIITRGVIANEIMYNGLNVIDDSKKILPNDIGDSLERNLKKYVKKNL